MLGILLMQFIRKNEKNSHLKKTTIVKKLGATVVKIVSSRYLKLDKQ